MIDIWTYLTSEPLLWLTATLVAYAVGDYLSKSSGRNALVNPVLIAVVILAGALLVTETPYETYFNGAKFVHFMLGPATVCLAVPLFLNLAELRRVIIPVLAALLAGSLAAILSAILIGSALGLPAEILISMAPKSATAPVAMGISEASGGLPTLTAVLVILTGISGAIVVTPIFNALKIKDWRARGLAVGLTSHGIGTARAFQVHETAGTFAGVGMGLNALVTALLVPLILAVF